MTYVANLWTVHGIPRSAAQRASWLKTSALRYTWHIMPTSRKEVRLRSLRAPPHTPQRDENITCGVLPEHAEVSQKALRILLQSVLYHGGRTVLSCLCICTGRLFGFVTLAGRRSPSTTDALAKLKFDHMYTVCHMSTVFCLYFPLCRLPAICNEPRRQRGSCFDDCITMSPTHART